MHECQSQTCIYSSGDSGERRQSKPIFIFTKMGGRPYMLFHLPSPFIPVEPKIEYEFLCP